MDESFVSDDAPDAPRAEGVPATRQHRMLAFMFATSAITNGRRLRSDHAVQRLSGPNWYEETFQDAIDVVAPLCAAGVEIARVLYDGGLEGSCEDIVRSAQLLCGFGL